MTGASSGLGAGFCRALVRGGVTTIGIARSSDKLAALATELGDTFVPWVESVDDTAAHVATLRRFDAERGGIDLVIANAGVGADAAHPACSYEATHAALHTNFCGAAATLTALAPQLGARGRGHLVAISSLASFGALPSALAYSAPKAGLNMVCDCLRLDLAPRGVTVTTVHLGFVATAMVARSTHPLPQLQTIDAAVAHVLARLASRPASITYPALLGAGTKLFSWLPEGLRRGVLGRWA